MRWTIDNLRPTAMGVSASRRTDIPAFFGPWFERRLDEGFVEHVPAGPPRRVRKSIAAEDVTHLNFWTKWPRPFFRALERVLAIGYPVLWNVTITGLGGTEVEPNVPTTEKAVDAVLELSRIVQPAAIQWRYDPVFLSRCFDAAHHRALFTRIAAALAGHVDRVTTSVVEVYGRRVKPDLLHYSRETGDALDESSRHLELLPALRGIAAAHGIRFTTCCVPDIRKALGCEPAACNGWGWATRVYPELSRHRPLKAKPTRADCACSQEIDIGVYDTCAFGCRYSYGSCDLGTAKRKFARHDPSAPCLLP